MLSIEHISSRNGLPQASGRRSDHVKIEAAANGNSAGGFWLGALAALLTAVAVPAPALAQVPDDLLGRWSSDPNRCQQVNGEVDVLEMTKSGFDFYEIGCELGQPASDAVHFVAQCYKGGSPVSSGAVAIRRPAPDRIEIALQGFAWTSQKPEVFHRCRVD